MTGAGQVKGVRDAATNWTYFEYNLLGKVARQWGINVYPVEHKYDGRLTNMITFRTLPGAVAWTNSVWPNPSGGDVTQWVYDGPSGLLERKVYANGGSGSQTNAYTYTSGNFLNIVTNGRGQTIDYDFNTLGLLTNIVCSDGSTATSLKYDRTGRLQTIADASGSLAFTWDNRDQPLTETYTNGLLNSMGIVRTFDSQFRLQRFELKKGGSTERRKSLGYDSISWVEHIIEETSDGATVLNRFDYAFQNNTPFVESVTFKRGSTAVMTNRYVHDALGRLESVNATLTGGGSVNGLSYELDLLNRRSEATLADGTNTSGLGEESDFGRKRCKRHAKRL